MMYWPRPSLSLVSSYTEGAGRDWKYRTCNKSRDLKQIDWLPVWVEREERSHAWGKIIIRK